MEHSVDWCNNLGKLAESQHTSKMTPPQTERAGRAKSEKVRLVGGGEKDGFVRKQRETTGAAARELVSSADYQSKSAFVCMHTNTHTS